MNMSRPPIAGPAIAFVAFGANLGDPERAYAHAVDALGALRDTQVLRRSSLYRSAPMGVSGHPDYLNAVVALQTALRPAQLLAALLEIERDAGRTRESHQAPRTMDLDLLLYGDEVIHEAGLDVPHPRMHNRAFVLVPLAEVAPELEIPGHGALAGLLAAVAEQEISKLRPGDPHAR